jgi:hypothetical protein
MSAEVVQAAAAASQSTPTKVTTPLLHLYCCQVLFSNSIAHCCTRYCASYDTPQVRMSNTEISTPGTTERGSGSMVLKKNGVRGPPSPPPFFLASTDSQVPTVHTTPIACLLSACVNFFAAIPRHRSCQNCRPSLSPHAWSQRRICPTLCCCRKNSCWCAVLSRLILRLT